jgi:deoxyribodipyrimidine photo-lyase
MSRAVYWMRRDMRLEDNRALATATSQADQVTIVFVSTPKQWQSHECAPIQLDFVERRANYLAEQCAGLGIDFHHIASSDYQNSTAELLSFCLKHQVTKVFANKEYEWNEQQRDKLLGNLLVKSNINYQLVDDKCVIEPGRLLNKSGLPFKVFSAFKKQWLNELKEADLVTTHHKQKELLVAYNKPQRIVLDTVKADSSNWPVEDSTIKRNLSAFIDSRASEYQTNRDLPNIAGTSRLSPYLATGMLSVRQVIVELLQKHPDCLDSSSETFSWVNELIWRDFYQHVIYHFPDVVKGKAFLGWTDDIHWSANMEALEHWKQGKTGIPIIDAGMRELLATGWMHNRVRMIVASFLVKDLHINWRVGESWFMQNLIDGDFAANNGGWQWCASTGTDAQPYFRVFNPYTQSKKFDPEGEYIKTYVPELRNVPAKYIHQPELWLQANGHNAYPAPIVDHAKARLHAIEIFENAKKPALAATA